jgi:hypothetical protein
MQTLLSINNLQAKIRFFVSSAELCHHFFSRAGALHRNNRYRMRSLFLSFLSKNIVSTKWRIYKGILQFGWSQTPEARKLGVLIVFFNFKKIFYRDLKWKKSFVKKKNPFQCMGFIYENQQF